MTNTTIALATALLLGVTSAAYAAGGSRNEADHTGGYRVGPFGNVFQTGVNPARTFLAPRSAYGYAYRARGKRNRSR